MPSSSSSFFCKLMESREKRYMHGVLVNWFSGKQNSDLKSLLISLIQILLPWPVSNYQPEVTEHRVGKRLALMSLCESALAQIGSYLGRK